MVIVYNIFNVELQKILFFMKLKLDCSKFLNVPKQLKCYSCFLLICYGGGCEHSHLLIGQWWWFIVYRNTLNIYSINVYCGCLMVIADLYYFIIMITFMYVKMYVKCKKEDEYYFNKSLKLSFIIIIVFVFFDQKLYNIVHKTNEETVRHLYVVERINYAQSHVCVSLWICEYAFTLLWGLY